MGQHQRGDGIEMVFLDRRPAQQSRLRSGRFHQQKIGSVTLHPRGQSAIDGQGHDPFRDLDAIQMLARPQDVLLLPLLIAVVKFTKGRSVGLKSQPAPHDLASVVQKGQTYGFHAQTETVEKLGAKLAFFSIHASHQHEARGLAQGQTLTLELQPSAGGNVKHRVAEVFGQKIHFVDVQDALVGLAHKSRLVSLSPLQRLLQVQASQQTILGHR
jgi:hypothetical protein